MPVAPLTITRPKLLLGEGVDEIRFFNALLTWTAPLSWVNHTEVSLAQEVGVAS
jgi:hypothetical protein